MVDERTALHVVATCCRVESIPVETPREGEGEEGSGRSDARASVRCTGCVDEQRSGGWGSGTIKSVRERVI